ncbi:glycerol-3-phosphate acyltransferase [Pantanalinema sp. GBBB05]|uniref:glycerol-3-phosphate acyltransferase n=1 Tax=Pantanalinema sp. GBBB05 TaxID=2604139 RepID=UPI001D513D3D|nr:pyruvate phosphate dikinase PEP/pyruvate-binding protein [Pantanalinema sp. GBBB05]
MTLTQVWGALLIFILCPLWGGLPLVGWITQALTGKKLSQLGTGNIGVSAAFYHGGKAVGILAVLSEAGKGIAAVWLARTFFPLSPAWVMVALIALVMGRYWVGKGAGTTNVVWGYIAFDPVGAALLFLISSISFTILRERRQGRFGVLILLPLITALRHIHETELIVATIALSALLGWIYTKIPDDLDLSPPTGQTESQTMFKFFRGDRALRSLDQSLDADQVGSKAATLSDLKRLGYPVPIGWVLAPGDDPAPLIAKLQPSPQQPFVVRSSAVGEDSDIASAAGQYETVLSVTSQEELPAAIHRCLASYDRLSAVQYRQQRGVADASMAVIVQQQIRGVFSGVAFSRDPIARQGDEVVIEALPGNASQVVSGQVTPESYQVTIGDAIQQQYLTAAHSWQLPDELSLTVQGSGDIPPRLIQQVAFLARSLEQHYHGIPQDIEWSYDGQTLWLLQSRPITTLLPIWTRKIASEVIPGMIRPLTWSINRPLTCGVWGDLFTLVLAERATGLDFGQTATLHYSRAYFNASLLGQIFRRMGLPPESLEFLTRGAKFSKPPLRSTLRSLPGLLRLWQRERRLDRDFQQHDRQTFTPALLELAQQPASTLSATELLQRIDHILNLLKLATYYSIMAPLSAALRKAIAKVSDEQIDSQATPEVAALRSLQELAGKARAVLERSGGQGEDKGDEGDEQVSADVFVVLATTAEGREILGQFEQLLEHYGYLSEVGTDIAVPTWKEDPTSVRASFQQFCLYLPPIASAPPKATGKVKAVQQRFDLKGRVTEVYSRLLAELRWAVIALEQQWLAAGRLQHPGDIFFLELDEIRQVIQPSSLAAAPSEVFQWVELRQAQLERDRQLHVVPFLVYGDDPPQPMLKTQGWQVAQQLRGIAASPGQVEGRIRIVRDFKTMPEISTDTILVVPYTDSGWAPLLARAKGLIAEVGGRLSHGAIVAREYRIPAIMDVHNATHLLKDGQFVRMDGQQGTIDLL